MTTAERNRRYRAQFIKREDVEKMIEEKLRTPAPPLPGSVADMLAGLRVNVIQSLNTHVNDIHIALWGDEKLSTRYRALLQPIWNEESEEGSLVADDFALAAMIREYAKDNKYPFVAAAKLAAIRRSHNVVLRRYGLSRRQRRNLVDGSSKQDDMFTQAEGE